MDDIISRQALMKEFSDFVRASNNSNFARTPTWNDAVSLVGSMPSAQPENKELLAWQEDFQGYIKMLNLPRDDYKGIMEYINEVPFTQPDKDLIHLQKEQAYMQGYEDGKKSRKGEWILDNPHSKIYKYACSKCKAYHGARYDFCPSCGSYNGGKNEA